jgi:diguanylate cyclase (GGDEF)-like protein
LVRSHIPGGSGGTRTQSTGFRRDVTRPFVLAVLAAVLIVSVVAYWSARRIDELSLARQARLVSHAVTNRIADLPHDQESVTIWDDAVRNIKLSFNEEWIDRNIGTWMHDYFGHDEVAIIDDRDRVIYSMADGTRHAVETDMPPAVRPLVSRLRGTIADGPAPVDGVSKPPNPRIVDLAVVQGRPAIVALMPFVSDSGEIKQASNSEYLLLSVQYFDGEFLTTIAEQYLLQGARFSQAGALAADEASFPLMTADGKPFGYFAWMPVKPGRQFLGEIAPVLAAAAALLGLIITVLIRRLRMTFTELRASEAQSQHLAFHDSLTGLANRMLLNDYLDNALAEVRARSSGLVLFVVDIDRFRDINDTLGHPAGDAVLSDVAARLKAVLRAEDFVARTGGDGFCIVRMGAPAKGEITDLCRGMMARIAMPFDMLGEREAITVSIGVAASPAAGVDRIELLRKADIAAFQAKANGGNSFVVFSETMSEAIESRIALERELRRALETPGELALVYQPIYSAATSTIVGLEALLRWHHPRLGTLLPAAFVAIAEETGLIEPLGKWALKEACTAAAHWRIGTIAVNVSPIQLRRADFAQTVLAITRGSGLSPSTLELEITESNFVDSAGPAVSSIAALRQAGVRIALDDFGTGYSSLGYLKRLPVDRLKIDRAFVQTLDTEPGSIVIIEAMVALARAMEIHVTAEGVESREQQLALIRAGCNNLQGFFLSPPVPAEQVEHILSIRRTSRPGPVAAAAE